jgi:hypothetical protein
MVPSKLNLGFTACVNYSRVKYHSLNFARPIQKNPKMQNVIITATEYLHDRITISATLREVAAGFNAYMRCRIMTPTPVFFFNNFLFSAPFIPSTTLTPLFARFKLVWEGIYTSTNNTKRD